MISHEGAIKHPKGSLGYHNYNLISVEGVTNLFNPCHRG